MCYTWTSGISNTIQSISDCIQEDLENGEKKKNRNDLTNILCYPVSVLKACALKKKRKTDEETEWVFIAAIIAVS